jgi:hypothetical protein
MELGRSWRRVREDHGAKKCAAPISLAPHLSHICNKARILGGAAFF